jgi:hypothetical protein
LRQARDIIPLPGRAVDRGRVDDEPLSDAEREFLDWLLEEALSEWQAEQSE